MSGLASRNMETFRFLDLPAELRNAIYAEFVVVGDVVYSPTTTTSRDHKKPDLTLLRVCKQICDEAESLYLSKNMLRFPNNWLKCLPFAETTDSSGASLETLPRHMFSQAAFKFVRNISLAFTSDQLSLQLTTKSSGSSMKKSTVRDRITRLVESRKEMRLITGFMEILSLNGIICPPHCSGSNVDWGLSMSISSTPFVQLAAVVSTAVS
ncbi:hypothetical protein FB567DRAFT_603595 [Paraphoma chrysanthemicola]|uniref:Uncharacterized protein n=1 Tax=Paraphoma chrysanthemicola TaxID=798071 RepID=A0A8K0R6X3_9PLEO|nr:hypothetical protein FB567DRAFT_603595 [Paraphoma chrysanthemicola]